MASCMWLMQLSRTSQMCVCVEAGNMSSYCHISFGGIITSSSI